MTDPSQINAEVKVDLTHTADTLADMSHETHHGIGKIFYACYGPWVEQRVRKANLIAAQTEKDAQDIIDGRKQLNEETGKLIELSEPSGIDTLCYELTMADNAYKAKRLTNAIMLAVTKVKQIPENEISDEPLNQTFFNHWKEEAELIDDDDLRQIWAKLLVEETRKSNSVSPRTLNVVKNLSRQDAVIFEKVGKCIVGNNVVVNSADHPLNGEYGDILMLQEAGLIGQKSSSWYGAAANNTTIIPLANGNFCLTAICSKITFRSHILTRAGLQLLKYVETSDDIRYFQMIAREISRQNGNLCIRIVPVEKGTINLAHQGIWNTDTEKKKEQK